MDSFASKQLTKYGWIKGRIHRKGLGKNENGITESIRPKLKFDTTGIGHKNTDTNNWWENVFNCAAKGIKVETKSDNILIKTNNENVVLSKKQNNFKSLYQNFSKTSTLCNGRLIENNVPTKKVDAKNGQSNANIELSDEDLLKACKGRTGHKGARHGVTSNGKLERIARQERALLASISKSYECQPKKRKKTE
ncbi:G patch domain-containing protein 4-like [Prorops nasuta]|uniref:G patch domain-containing protein 4-like n=1 Tax=Prorops nasuta TaxID=863751 RepID=UPI0034CEA179